MTYTVDFADVSTVGLESSPVAPALAGLRANEARYFKNKYDETFTVESATKPKAKKLVKYVADILKKERDIVIASPALEATELEVDGIRWTHVFYESGLAINVLYTLADKGKRAVGFKLSDGMAIPYFNFQMPGAGACLAIGWPGQWAATFSRSGDDVRVAIKRSGRRYTVDVKGASLDARALIKLYMSDAEGVASKTDAKSVSVDAQVGALGGFGGERLSDVTFSYAGDGSRVDSLKVDAASTRGGRVTFRGGTENGQRTMRMQSNDAGAIVRFLDIYEHMEGGVIDLSLAGRVDSPRRRRATGAASTRRSARTSTRRASSSSAAMRRSSRRRDASTSTMGSCAGR